MTSMAIIKSRQQHNEDYVRWQIEADEPRSRRRAVDARAVERSQGALTAVAGRVLEVYAPNVVLVNIAHF